jgi:ABC-2 type transport system permease protein
MRVIAVVLRRIFAIAGKELRDVWRQPRLVLALVVGPFLILLIFGTGYQSIPPPLATILVVEDGSGLSGAVEELQESLEPAVTIVDVTQDLAGALQRLRDGEVDIIVATPAEALDTVRGNEQAVVEVFHDKLDPFDQAYITIFTRSSVDELNRRVLESVTREGQERSEQLDDALPVARASAQNMATALEAGDAVAATQARIELDRALLLTQRRTGSSEDLLRGVSRELGAPGEETRSVSALRREVSSIDFSDPDAPEQARALSEELETLEQELTEFQALDPGVLVAPFQSALSWVRGESIPLEAFYGPAVLIVLLQHSSVTLGALSMVRERSLGIDRWFRVTPMSTYELVAGKFLGYGFLGTVIGVGLTFGILSYFGLTMTGSWGNYALVIGLVLLSSLALGFLVAAISTTEAQAVQFSMLVLLVTIFFSGFVLSLDRIIGPAAAVSELVPATAGISGLQDVLFRGEQPAILDFVRLSVYTVVALSGALLLLRRRRTD